MKSKKEQLQEKLVEKLVLDILKEEYSKEQIEEFNLGGLSNVAKGIKDRVSDKVSSTVNQVKDKVGSAVDTVKKDYYKGTLSSTEAKLMQQMEKVKDFIILYNERAKKAGEPLLNPRKLMSVLNKIPTK